MTSPNKSELIAQNTLLLYVRMAVLMCVNIYTSRVVLNNLGVVDYGLYNVIGGVVGMLSILSSSLSIAISRYLTFEIGRKNFDKLKRIFSTSLVVQLSMAIIVISVAEIVGVWFLNTEMNIPLDRLSAANWILQLSIISFAISMLIVPFNALIIAHENMAFFSYITVIEAMLKLLAAIIIGYVIFDALVTYGLFILIVSICILLIYAGICKSKFCECNFHFIFNRELLKDMMTFAGWNFIGSTSGLMMLHGINILMNIFFGVKINTARGIATQVDNAVNQFVYNFTLALNPQITKSYADKNFEYMYELVCRGAKYSFFLYFIFALPLFFEAPIILRLWLNMVPDYTVLFVRLSLINSLFAVLTLTMITSALATGDIKKYQIVVGGFALLDVPLCYIAFRMGFNPSSAYVISIFINICLIYVRLLFIRSMIKMKIRMYLIEVIVPVSILSLFAPIIPYLLHFYILDSFFRVFFVIVSCFIFSIVIIYYLGLNNTERNYVVNFVLQKIIRTK